MSHLILTLSAFFTLLAIPLFIERLFTGTVSGRGLLASALLAVAFACFRVIRCRKREIAADADARLRRRALLHLNGSERGETDWQEIFYLLVAIAAFGLLLFFYGGVGLCHAADPVHIDQILTEATGQLYPLVPLTAKELSDLQAVAFSIAVLTRATADYPVDMDTATRERRASVKRTLQAVHEKLVDIQVMQAGAVIQATRKGGAR